MICGLYQNFCALPSGRVDVSFRTLGFIGALQAQLRISANYVGIYSDSRISRI